MKLRVYMIHVKDDVFVCETPHPGDRCGDGLQYSAPLTFLHRADAEIYLRRRQARWPEKSQGEAIVRAVFDLPEPSGDEWARYPKLMAERTAAAERSKGLSPVPPAEQER